MHVWNQTFVFSCVHTREMWNTVKLKRIQSLVHKFAFLHFGNLNNCRKTFPKVKLFLNENDSRLNEVSLGMSLKSKVLNKGIWKCLGQRHPNFCGCQGSPLVLASFGISRIYLKRYEVLWCISPSTFWARALPEAASPCWGGRRPPFPSPCPRVGAVSCKHSLWATTVTLSVLSTVSSYTINSLHWLSSAWKSQSSFSLLKWTLILKYCELKSFYQEL